MSRETPVIFALFAFFLLFFSGCAQEESEYVVTGEGEDLEYGAYKPASSDTLVGAVVKEWRLFSIIFLMISVALVAIVFAVSEGLQMPRLRAWAEVELGEAVSTALIVMFVVGGLVFVELVTHGIIMGTDDFDCTASTDFCPVVVAEQYLDEYLEKTMAVYDDVFDNAVKAGKLGTLSFVVGTNYLLFAYLSISFKLFPHFMIDATTATQQMQFLLGMRDALVLQQFLLNHVSAVLAPMFLMVGIVFRSFFITRKLGGLLMSFGIGFLLVFPLMYALSLFTLNNTIHGSTTTGGEVTGDYCTAACREIPPVAYDMQTGEPYSRSEVMELFPLEGCENAGAYSECFDGLCGEPAASLDDCGEGEIFNPSGFCFDPVNKFNCETGEGHIQRIKEFVSGENCTYIEMEVPLPEGVEGEPDIIETEACDDIISWESPVNNHEIETCGQYDEICPSRCRTLPYPSTDPECSSTYTEYQCREIVPEECFRIPYANMSDPLLAGLEEIDTGACPEECRPVAGLKKEGCDIGYGFVLNRFDTVEDVNAQMEEDGYAGQLLSDSCWERYDGYPSIVSEALCSPEVPADRTLKALGFKDLDDIEEEVEKTVIWEEGCPGYCRWIKSNGGLPIECASNPYCDYTLDPLPIWNAAHSAWENDDLEAQKQMAKQSCYMIIPSNVFISEECESCNFLKDPGFASYPPVHQKCAALCGKAKNVAVSKEGNNNA
ncbi:hypothetical protein GF415_03905, partial [Candidatus Micrarchaeota archaeon]|nr:hypothetical protein [Candidatus Micrarchaeota archaeon]